MSVCVFCDIIAGDASANVVETWYDAFAIVPLDPVTEGHVIVIPYEHVADFTTDPEITGGVMKLAAKLAGDYESVNLITSKGAAATQTVRHLHVHIVPRRPGDGLMLPWSEDLQAEVNDLLGGLHARLSIDGSRQPEDL